MKPHFSVLITGADSLDEALDLLSQRASLGLVAPFIATDSALLSDPSGRGKGRLSDPSGRREVDLLETLGRREYRTIRVVAMAGPDLENADELGVLAQDVCSQLNELAPPGLRVVQVRMWLPLRADPIRRDEPALARFFSPRADANLVVIPEDRSTSDSLASPVAQPDSPTFVEHVATETATLVGLWTGMTESPVDDLESGVLGFGESKLHLARSFVRVAQVDSPQFATSFNHRGYLPAPEGLVEAPYPEPAMIDVAEQFERRLRDAFEFRSPDSATIRGWRFIFLRLGRGITSFMGRLPEWLFGSSRDPVEKIVRREMGDSSTTAAVCRAVAGEPESEPSPAEQSAAAARNRFQVAGGARIPQQIWRDMGDAVLGMVDGGPVPEVISPPRSHTRHALITDLGVLFPCPDRSRNDESENSPSLPDRIRQDTTTLFGRIGTALSKIIDANGQSLRAAVGEFDDEFAQLGRRRLPDLAWISVVFIGLLLAALVGLILGTGPAEALGIVAMTGAQRTFVWICLTGLMVVAIVASTVSAHSEYQNRERQTQGRRDLKRSLRRLAAVTVGVAATAALAYAVSSDINPYDALGFGAALGLFALQVGLIWTLRSTPMVARVLRHFILITMVYASIGVIGLLARQHGWYGDVDASERTLRLSVAAGVALMLALAVLVVAGWWYGNAEHLLRSQLRTLAGLEEDITGAVEKEEEAREAREQFTGSAAAWADIIWHPFGAQDNPEDEEGQSRSFSAQKAALGIYRMPIGWLETAREKWVQRMAVPGWVSSQHKAAIGTFQQDYAGGLTAQYSDRRRPDEDPRVVTHLADSERARISLRWRFLSTLRSGEHDPALRERLDRIQDPEGSDWVLSEIDTLIPARTGGPACRDFLLSILPDLDAEVNPVYFRQKALVDKTDRDWRPRVWLPPVDHHQPGGDAQLGRVDICLLRNGHNAVFSVRHDLAGPYELTAFFTDSAPPRDQPSDSLDPDAGPIL